jgi:hypothetical protein
MGSTSITLDAKPIVSIETIDGYAWEGGPTTAAFVLRREGAIASELKVEYTLSGDALEGDDYEDLMPHWVTFAALAATECGECGHLWSATAGSMRRRRPMRNRWGGLVRSRPTGCSSPASTIGGMKKRVSRPACVWNISVG